MKQEVRPRRALRQPSSPGSQPLETFAGVEGLGVRVIRFRVVGS